jgi:hypothetical protein
MGGLGQCRNLRSDFWWHMNCLINVKQLARNPSKSSTNSTLFWQSSKNLHDQQETMHTCLKSNELGFLKHPSIVEKKIEICKQEDYLQFLDEDLGSLHFLFTIFYCGARYQICEIQFCVSPLCRVGNPLSITENLFLDYPVITSTSCLTHYARLEYTTHWVHQFRYARLEQIYILPALSITFH